MVLAIGSEVTSIGIGLDLTGAVFLSVSLLKSPVSAASLLFSNPSFAGKRAASELTVRHTVESMLQGRMGAICLIAGFLLQLMGLVLPSCPQLSLVPFLLGLLAIVVALCLGNRWIGIHRNSLLEEVWRAHRIDVVVHDVADMRSRQRVHPPWKEPWLFRFLEHVVDRP